MSWQNTNGLDFGSKLQGLFLSLAQAVLSAELTALLERRKALKREQKEAAKEQKNLSRKKQRLLKTILFVCFHQLVSLLFEFPPSVARLLAA